MDHKKPKHHKQKKDFKRQAANKSEGRLSGPSLTNYRPAGPTGSDETEDLSIDRDDSTVHNKTYSKRQIETNWAKYEAILPTDDSAYNVSKATDFASLLNAPMSEGGHFKFKSESSWESYLPSQYSNIFKVDLQKLAGGLSCIPFYKQLSLSQELFDEDQVNRMDAEAQLNSVQYNLYLKEKSVTVVSDLNLEARDKETANLLSVNRDSAKSCTKLQETGDKRKSPKSASADLQPTVLNVSPSTQLSNNLKETTTDKCIIPISEDDNDLDFLLSLKEPVTVSRAVPTTLQNAAVTTDDLTAGVATVSLQASVTDVPVLKTENLEDWLDAMLDD